MKPTNEKIRFIFQVFPFCYLSVQSIWSIYWKVSSDIALKYCKIHFWKSATHWPILDIECAIWSTFQFWGKSDFFKKSRRVWTKIQPKPFLVHTSSLKSFTLELSTVRIFWAENTAGMLWTLVKLGQKP